MSVVEHGKGTSLWLSCGMSREQDQLRAGQWVGPVGRREDTTQAHIYACMPQIICTRSSHMWIVHIHTYLWLHHRKCKFPFSSLMCCCAIPAYSMAEMRTSQVGGCLWGLPWPFLHLTSPTCTISSSFKGWALKQASIVNESRPTPSRIALAFPAAFLLTYCLKSIRWSGQSAEEQDPSHLWMYTEGDDDHMHSPVTSWHNALSPSLGTGGVVEDWGGCGFGWGSVGICLITQSLRSASLTSCRGMRGMSECTGQVDITHAWGLTARQMYKCADAHLCLMHSSQWGEPDALIIAEVHGGLPCCWGTN